MFDIDEFDWSHWEDETDVADLVLTKRNFRWTDKLDKEYKLKDISDTHLSNIIKWCKKRNDTGEADKLIAFLEKEELSRIKKLLKTGIS